MTLRHLPCVLLVACGGSDARIDAAPGTFDAGVDAPPPADAYIADAVVPECTPVSPASNVSLEEVAQAGDAVLLITAPKGDARQFIVERDGIVRTMKDDVLSSTAFLDIRGRVAAGGERGLLGLAFHPNYAANQRLFVYYTAEENQVETNVISEFRATGVDFADPDSEKILLSIPDFAPNHNGGMIEFGSDGFLYIATGDGGGGGDPEETGQDADSLLGKMLRIDVDSSDGARPYGIPLGNPFAAVGGGAPEVFALGLRNPWRWSFDRATDAIYIGDVGQDAFEELNRVTVTNAAGANFGWNEYEADSCYDPPCIPDGKTFPILTIPQDPDGYCSVIAGQVYRGTCFPDLVGRFFWTDYCEGGLRSFVWNDAVTDPQLHDQVGVPTSLYADARGELYLGNENGRIYRLRADP